MNGFGVYWNNNDEKQFCDDKNEIFIKNMEETMKIHENNENFKFILDPISLNLNLNIAKKEKINGEIPEFSIQISLDQIHINLHEIQYNQILRVIQWISLYNKREKKLNKIPEVSIEKEPLLHWKYLLSENLKKVRKLKNRFTSDFLDHRRKMRLEYSLLWKEHLLTKSIIKKSKLKELEEILSYEDIAFFRIRAESELRSEDLPSSSWSSWCLSWINSTDTFIPEFENHSALSDENLELFYETIGISEDVNQIDDIDSTNVHTSFFTFFFIQSY